MRLRRHVIRPHRPLRSIGFVVLVFVALGILGYVLHLRDRQADAQEIAALKQERDSLQETVSELNARGAAMRERLAILERARQVDGKAYADVGEHLRSLQDEVLALKEEVAFYRGIVSAGKETGLNIQTFVLDKDGESNAYRFQLVLTQNMKRAKVIKGTVKLSVTGEQGGQSRRLNFDELSGEQTRALEFQFKYFQRLEGKFTLPEGFVPRQVHVNASASGKRPKNVEQAFDWQGLIG